MDIKHTLWELLKAPCQGASNEYPQHVFLCRNKLFNIHSYLELCHKLFYYFFSWQDFLSKTSGVKTLFLLPTRPAVLQDKNSMNVTVCHHIYTSVWFTKQGSSLWSGSNFFIVPVLRDCNFHFAQGWILVCNICYGYFLYLFHQWFSLKHQIKVLVNAWHAG